MEISGIGPDGTPGDVRDYPRREFIGWFNYFAICVDGLVDIHGRQD